MGYLRYYLGTAFMLMGVAGLVLGGPWVWLGAGTFPLLIALDLPFGRPDFSERHFRHPALADVPLYLHVVLMMSFLGLGAWRIGVLGAQAAPPMGQIAGCMISIAWLAAVPGLPVTHELIHRREKHLQVLALLLSVTLIYPVRRLAHLRGHHVHFGMTDDTDTARRGETLFGFSGRVMIAAAVDAFRSERQRLAKEGRSVLSWRGDVAQALALTLAGFAVFGLLGWWAVGTMAVGFLVSTLLTEGFNYFQHYGLVRVPGTRAGPRHVWSHLAPVNRAIALEITNHVHHHMEPTVPFYKLKPDPQAPQMPSIVLCFVAGLVPPIFIRLIAMPKLRHWDLNYATPEERELAAKANAAAGWPDWFSSAASTTTTTTATAEGRPSAPALG